MSAIVKKVILIFIMFLGISGVVMASTYTTTTNNKEIKNVYLDTMNIRLFGIESDYDLREKINLKVKNQEDTSFCWAISTTTVLESYMGLVKNKQVEYSPKHIEYATSKTFLDGENVDAHNREVNSGGSALIAYAYITSGRGPVYEEEMPFSASTEKIKLSEIEEKTVDLQLEEYVVFPNVYKRKVGDVVVYTNGQTGENIKLYTDAEITAFRNQIKEHIVKYGGITAQVNATRFDFYSNPDDIKASTCYYCNDESVLPNHQVTIVGWDDNYAITNFNEYNRPTKPGAYLVQNSFGAEVTIEGVTKQVFDSGYMYISYEDFLVETAMTGITKMSDIDYAHIYQYDPLGCNKYITNATTEITGANVFTKSEKQECLSEVSFYTVDGCSYEIYVNSEDGELTQAKLEKVATVEPTSNVHYTTVSLEKPVLLTGNEFAVAIKYKSKDIASLPVECVPVDNPNDVFYNAESKSGESFMCLGSDFSNWSDFKEVSIGGISQINVCLKAFTTEVDLVKGDLNGDGKLTGTDLLKLKKHIVKLELLPSYYLEAADVNLSGDITSTDLLKLKQAIIGIIKF